MRVLMLADAQFAAHERALIERVMVGLAVEGIGAQIVLPKDRGLEAYGFELISEPIFYADRGLALTQRIRANQVARQVTNNADDMTGVIDIVHVFGGGAWSMAREMARILDAGAVFEVWRDGLADTARGLHLSDEDRAVFLVPEKSFEAGLIDAGFGQRVHLAPWGAQVPAEPMRIFREGKHISIVMMGSGRQKESSIAAFEGIVDAIGSREDVMVFANPQLVHRAGLWERVKEERLDSRFTIIDKSEDRRDLLLRCDLMVYPDTLHEERTLLLDAMGAGMAIIASGDEKILPIRDDSGVMVVQRPNRSDWGELIRDCIEHPDRARQAGLAARGYVTRNRRSAMHIEAIKDAYNAICGIEPQPDPD